MDPIAANAFLASRVMGINALVSFLLIGGIFDS
jgi:hypothetical protein